MLTPISRVTKELKVPRHQLYKWEERGWLGFETVLKDPKNQGQRIYTAEQVKRIEVIVEEIERQRQQGIKRTDFGRVEEVLLEKFGGEITQIPKAEMMLPGSVEQIIELMQLQNKKIIELQQMIEQKEPVPNYEEEFKEVKKELEFSKEREEKLITLIKELQDRVEVMDRQPVKKTWKFWQ